MSLHFRIAGVLVALVALNALFVIALVWAYGVLVPGVVAGTFVYLQQGSVGFAFLQLPVSLPLAGTLVVGFLAVQLYYGYGRVLASADVVGTSVSEHTAEISTVTRGVQRLAMTADVPAPAVRVIENDLPNCYTVGRLTDATVVVTTGLLDALEPDELEAVLAHEVAHVANRDVTLMTVTTIFLEIAERAYGATQLIHRAVLEPGDLSASEKATLEWLLPLAVLTYVFVAPIIWLFAASADRSTRTLSHARELAADDAAARISGKPLALASALVTLSENITIPEDDLRREGATRTDRMAALHIVATADPDARSVTATHPPVDERVERLQRLAAEQEMTS